MKTDIENRYRFDLPEGTIYVHVRAAETKWYGYGDERYSVTIPCVYMTTTESVKGWRYEEARDYVKIRGRRYSIDTCAERLPESQRRVIDWGPDTGQRMPAWQRARRNDPYRGGFRNAEDQAVGDGAKARDALWDICARAGEMLDEEHPEWALESARMELLAEVSSHESKISRAREEIERGQAEIRKVEARMEALTA
jgi:hypothetical protein